MLSIQLDGVRIKNGGKEEKKALSDAHNQIKYTHVRYNTSSNHFHTRVFTNESEGDDDENENEEKHCLM
jgi:hypothetical protein